MANIDDVYGGAVHGIGCVTHVNDQEQCSCGLDAALSKVPEAVR